MNRWFTIQFKIAFWAGLCLTLTAVIIIIYAASSLRTTSQELAKRRAVAIAENKSVSINEELEVAWNTARTLAQTLSTSKKMNREQVQLIFQKVLEDSPQIAGIYTLWEPDAFDQMDSRFQDKAPYNQANGRLAFYWGRDSKGNIEIESVNVSDESDTNSYYRCVNEIMLECITDPHTRMIQGEEITVISLIVPVVIDGEFYGVVGADLRLDFFQRLVDTANIYDGAGLLSILTFNGMIVATAGQTELAGKYASVIHPDFDQDNEISRIQQGSEIAEFNEHNELEIFVPIHFSRTWTPWSVNVIIPMNHIVADSTKQMWQMIGIGVALTLFALLIVGIVARQIAQPIKDVTTMAKKIAEGDLDVSTTVQTRDETGVLAKVFNQMVANLKQTLDQTREANEALSQQNEEQRKLLDLVSELETPAIPLVDSILFAPVVGALDSRRAQNLMSRLLEEVHQNRSRQVVIDITGVPTVDTQVAHALLQTARALKLLGCQVSLTGVSPAVATTITTLGVDMQDIMTGASLQEMLEYRD